MKPVKVLFVCLGNSIRSQMAEAYARTYGRDVIEPASAGLMPATMVAPLAFQVMREKNIDLAGHFPKGLGFVNPGDFDLLVNMSGFELPPGLNGSIQEWKVPDPIGADVHVYRDVSALIESRVMRLILELRRRGNHQDQESSKI